MAGTGIEPVTFHFSGERCYRLSYPAKGSCVEAELRSTNATIVNRRVSDPDGT